MGRNGTEIFFLMEICNLSNLIVMTRTQIVTPAYEILFLYSKFHITEQVSRAISASLKRLSKKMVR